MKVGLEFAVAAVIALGVGLKTQQEEKGRGFLRLLFTACLKIFVPSV